MKRITLLFLCLWAVSSQAQTLVNQELFDTLSHPTQRYGYIKVLPDGAGNYVLLYNILYTGGEKENYQLIKINSSGVPVASYMFNSLHNGSDFGTNLYIKGNYAYSCGFTIDSPLGTHRINAVKLDMSRWDTVWTISESIDSITAYQAPFSILVDDDESVYIAGTVQTPTSYKMTAVKYDVNGIRQWVTSYDTTGYTTVGAAMTINGDNYLAVTGSRFDNLGHSDFVTVYLDPASGSYAGLKIEPNGTGTISHPIAIVTDMDGNNYISGTSTVSGLASVVKLVKYDSLYNKQWAVTWGDSTQTQIAAAMSSDFWGNNFIAGTKLNANGTSDLFVVAFGADGSLLGNVTVPSTEPNEGYGAKDIVRDDLGGFYVTGYKYTGIDSDLVTIGFDDQANMKWMKTFNRCMGCQESAYNVGVSDDGTTILVSGKSEGADSLYFIMKYEQESSFIPPDSESSNVAYSYYQNEGQIFKDSINPASDVRYYTNFGHPQIYLGDKTLSYVFAKVDGDTATIDSLNRVDFKLLNANNPKIYPTESQDLKLNYLMGHLSKPITKVQANNSVVYKSIYNGIDWHISSNQNGLKYSFIVTPGTDPSQILFQYEGASDIDLDGDSIGIASPFGYLQQNRVLAFQVDQYNEKSLVTVSYNDQDSNKYGFTVGSYDPNNYLIIQVSLARRSCSPVALDDHNPEDWSTYIGGNGEDVISDIYVDQIGNLFACGYTTSNNFPNVGLSPIPQATLGSSSAPDAFVMKFNKNGAPKFATYFGGSGIEKAFKIKVNEGDQSTPYIYIVGYTTSTNMPVNPSTGAGSSTYLDLEHGFIAKLTYDGSGLSWARYITSTSVGGYQGYTSANALAIDNNNNVYVTGYTYDLSGFPILTKTGAYNQSFSGGGSSAFILEFSPNNTQLWGTFFTDNGHVNTGRDIAIGQNNDIYLLGGTNAHTIAAYSSPCTSSPNTNDFPGCNPGGGAYYQSYINLPPGTSKQIAFIAQFNSNGALVWCTPFGEQAQMFNGIQPVEDEFMSLAVNPSNRKEITITGKVFNEYTSNTSIFLNQFAPNEYGQTNPCPVHETRIFAAKFNDKQLVWSTNIGANSSIGYDVTYGNTGEIYIVGSSTNNAYATSPYECSIPSNYNTQTAYCPHSNTFSQSSAVSGKESVLFSTNTSNSMNWGTFYSGDADETPYCNTYDNRNKFVYICGKTNSTCQFPILDPGGGTYFIQSTSASTSQTDAFIGRFKVNISSPTNIEQINSKNSEISVYPNPTYDQLSIILGADEEIEQLEINDLSGRLIKSTTIASHTNNTTISTKDLAAGIYLLRVLSNETYKAIKFIKSD